MKIPVFHDDQHGTAIIVGCRACSTALSVLGKDIGEVKLVASGAGAAAIACLDLLVELGLDRENIWSRPRTAWSHAARRQESTRTRCASRTTPRRRRSTT
jgi:malate dehydrogenase (oxaloacetate-decarboxylating)(NADP+)